MMKSYGFEVPQAAIDAALSAMTGDFVALDIEQALSKAGCNPNAIPSRVADKLLQRERRAGRIKFGGGKWTVVA
jgi:hypothetical protein